MPAATGRGTLPRAGITSEPGYFPSWQVYFVPEGWWYMRLSVGESLVVNQLQATQQLACDTKLC